MLEENHKGVLSKHIWRSLPECIAIALLLFLWGATIWAYFYLPQSIPVHFNFKGVADRYGSKSNLFLLAIIATIIYVVLTLLPRKLNHFNFPNTKTKENTAAQIAIAGNVFLYLKIIVLFIFLILNLLTCFVSLKLAVGIGGWFYLLLAMLFIPAIVIVRKAINTK
jgi:uncharacterized membrane protein